MKPTLKLLQGGRDVPCPHGKAVTCSRCPAWRPTALVPQCVPAKARALTLVHTTRRAP